MLAAVVEMIHTATLVHDDVLDEAMVRRHAATVNAEWGNETSVLLGDYLFTHAFHLASSLDSTLACRWIGRATNLVCEGEMQQVHNRGNLDLSEADYFAIIRGKTAELTAVSCRLGATTPGPTLRPSSARRLWSRPGRRLPDRRRRARHLGRGAHHGQEPGDRPGEAEAHPAAHPPAGDRAHRDGELGATASFRGRPLEPGTGSGPTSKRRRPGPRLGPRPRILRTGAGRPRRPGRHSRAAVLRNLATYVVRRAS